MNDRENERIELLEQRVSKVEGELKILITLLTVNITLTVFTLTVMMTIAVNHL